MQVIERAFALLRVIADETDGIGVTELGKRVGLPKGTVSRFLSSLEQEGAVARTADNRVIIGRQIGRLAQPISFRERLALVVRPELEMLNQQTGEAVAMSILDGYTETYIAHLPSQHQIQVADWTGRSIPLHISSSGKLLLAYASDTFIENYLTAPLARHAKNTMTDAGQLRLSLKRIRKEGRSFTDEEFADEVISHAMPIWDKGGKMIAAVNVYGPKYRLERPGVNELIVTQLQDCVRRIGGRL